MNEFPKISYEPSEKRRFEVSKDEYSRERIKTVESFYEKMRNYFDVSMGLVLFGSLVKGKILDKENQENSDIDFTLFVDLDEYRKKYIENLRNNTVFAGFEARRLGEFCSDSFERKKLIESIRNIESKREIDWEEKDLIEKKIQRYVPDQFLFILAIWHGYINVSDSDQSEQFFYRGKQAQDVEKLSHLLGIMDVQVWPIQFSGEFSIRSQVEKVRDIYEDNLKNESDRNKYLLMQGKIGIARIFGLDVGGGMRMYKQSFVKNLLTEDSSEGEFLWHIVNESVRFSERENRIPESIERQFPETLQEAARHYGCCNL